MNPEIKAQWVAALRSGKYAQGTKALKQDSTDGITRHCCLGVLCELAKEEGIVTEKADGLSIMFGNGVDMWGNYPPEVVRKWAGISEKECEMYASLNDTGSTFGAIAFQIESEL